MKAALVTGGSGFIGHHLINHLQDYQVLTMSVDLVPPPADSKPDAFVQADVASSDFPELVESFNPDVVYHLAAKVAVKSSPEEAPEYIRTNVLGTALAALGATRAAAGLVFASSQAAVVRPGEEAPASLYGVTKHTGEYLLRNAGLVKLALLRFTNVYGPMHTVKGVVGRFIQAKIDDAPVQIHGSGQQTRDFIHVDDVCRALVAAGRVDSSVAVDVGTGVSTSIVQLAKALEIGVLSHTTDSPGVPSSGCDNTAAKEALDWKPTVALGVGLRRTLLNWKACPPADSAVP